jgi:DNA-binding LacI/PurR family transcriptional regulator
MAVTLRDIARHIGVSHATVSFVLNNRLDMGITESTRQRVLAAAQELGYKPNRAARALTTGRTDMLAICLPPHSDAYHSALLHGIQSAMKSSDFEAIVFQSHADSAEFKRPADLAVDGFISLDASMADAEFASGGNTRPGVQVGLTARPGWDNVVVDVGEAAVHAFQHLINVGCRRIAYLRPGSQGTGEDRFREAFLGLKSTPGISTSEIVAKAPGKQSAIEAVLAHIEEWNAPEGILCYSDSLAIAAKRALAEKGFRTPADVAIIGNGGTEESEYSWPAVSTISHPIREICTTAWEFMLHRLEWPTDQPQLKTFKAEFVPRQSSTGFKKKN